MKIILSGASGLVGFRVAEFLASSHEIIPLTSSGGIDVSNSRSVSKYISDISPDFIIHLAAKANVDECEMDREFDEKLLEVHVEMNFDVSAYLINNIDVWSQKKTAFAVNTVGTWNIAVAANVLDIPLLYISTDFVFDGSKDSYCESDAANPINWYGMTKYFGEEIVKKNIQKGIIARIAYPYGVTLSPKKDFVSKILGYLREKGALTLIDDQVITPTYIEDIAVGIQFLIDQKTESGIFHLVGDSSLTPYEIGLLLTKKTGIQATLSKIGGDEFFKGRAPRPFILKIENDKLERLGLKTLAFEEGLEKLLQNSDSL